MTTTLETMARRDAPIPTSWTEAVLPFPDHPMPVVLLGDGEALVGLRFGSADDNAVELGGAPRDDQDPILADAARQLVEYARGERDGFDLRLRMAGSDFQLAVWAALLAIPFGHTSTYGTVARLVDRPGQARAVGSAVGSNPIAIIVPCHRVLGANGSLTGFGGGLPNKAALLSREGVTAL